MKLATIADKIYITHWRDKYNAGYVFFFLTMSLPSYTAWITRESISLFVKCLVHDQCGITDISTAVIKISEYLRKSHKFNFAEKLFSTSIIYSIYVLE